MVSCFLVVSWHSSVVEGRRFSKFDSFDSIKFPWFGTGSFGTGRVTSQRHSLLKARNKRKTKALQKAKKQPNSSRTLIHTSRHPTIFFITTLWEITLSRESVCYKFCRADALKSKYITHGLCAIRAAKSHCSSFFWPPLQWRVPSCWYWSIRRDIIMRITKPYWPIYYCLHHRPYLNSLLLKSICTCLLYTSPSPRD